VVVAAVEGGFVDPEAGLAPDVEVADDTGVAVRLKADAVGPGPGDLEAGAVALAGGYGDDVGQVDVDGDAGHGRFLARQMGVRRRADPPPISDRKTSLCRKPGFRRFRTDQRKSQKT
jgi:hypothetical protein